MIIEDIYKLMSAIPYILSYFAPGYVFIVLFTHIALKNKNTDLEHILFRSAVTSFIIKSIFDLIFAPQAYGVHYYISLVVLSAVLAYLSGIFIRSDAFDIIQTKLKIGRTIHSNIWHDILRKDAWYRIYLKNCDEGYLGQITECEENAREPIVVMSRYQVLNNNNDILLDYSQNPYEKIIINLKDFDRIEQTVIPDDYDE